MHKIFLYFLFLLSGNIVLAQQSHVYMGKATFYAKKFNGRKTYSGERFSSNKYTAAHQSFPLQSLVKVTNPQNNKSVIVRINDRFRRKNFIDLSLIAAKQIDIIQQGIAKVKMQLLDTSFMQEYLNQTLDSNNILPITDTISVKIDTAQQFYIRLASFKLKKNAELLIAKKMPEKYKNNAIIQKTKHKGKSLYKVIIGAFSTKEEAYAEIAKLKVKFKDAIIFSK